MGFAAPRPRQSPAREREVADPALWRIRARGRRTPPAGALGALPGMPTFDRTSRRASKSTAPASTASSARAQGKTLRCWEPLPLLDPESPPPSHASWGAGGGNTTSTRSFRIATPCRRRSCSRARRSGPWLVPEIRGAPFLSHAPIHLGYYLIWRGRGSDDAFVRLRCDVLGSREPPPSCPCRSSLAPPRSSRRTAPQPDVRGVLPCLFPFPPLQPPRGRA